MKDGSANLYLLFNLGFIPLQFGLVEMRAFFFSQLYIAIVCTVFIDISTFSVLFLESPWF